MGNYEVTAKDFNGTRPLIEIVVTGFGKLDRALRGDATPRPNGRQRRRLQPESQSRRFSIKITAADLNSLQSFERPLLLWVARINGPERKRARVCSYRGFWRRLTAANSMTLTEFIDDKMWSIGP